MPSVDELEIYLFDVLGYDQAQIDRYSIEQHWEYLAHEQQVECLEYLD